MLMFDACNCHEYRLEKYSQANIRFEEAQDIKITIIYNCAASTKEIAKWYIIWLGV